MSREKKSLVILTTHFGNNFSGGSSATTEIFSRLQEEFDQVIAIGTKLGDHQFRNFRFHRYRHWIDAVRLIRKLTTDRHVFYGDFYNAFFFILARKPFYFTYHDNWPEIRRLNLRHYFLAFIYVPLYKWIFRKADHIVTVSAFKYEFIRRQTSKITLIRNGYRKQMTVTPEQTGRLLMVGTIDKRKYRLAIPLIKELEAMGNVHVDIYGNATDKRLARILSEFKSVALKGYSSDIPYTQYLALVHPSFMENLSIVFCEAVHQHLPVVAFDVGGAREVLHDDNALLIRPYDAKAMATACFSIVNDRKFQFDPSISADHDWNVASKAYRKLMI